MLLDVVISGERPLWPAGALAAKDTLRTDLSISDEMVPSTKPWMALPSGCIACSRKVRKMLWRLPPTHFGKEEGVERTLLRVACQSEPFLASPWQGDASIRFVGHIGCQSDFDELLSMACRPVDRGFCRMGETKEHPTPNKNTLPKQRHPTQTTTTLKQGHTARPRTPARTKRFGKFLLNLPG